MTLQQWKDNAWVTLVHPSPQVVCNLLAIAEREIDDGSLEGISTDGRLKHAYEAIRSLCEAALHACGYQVPKGGRKHERLIESLKFTLAGHWATDVDFLDRCRRLRHQSSYERSGVAQRADADELLRVARRLRDEARAWLQANHPSLIHNP